MHMWSQFDTGALLKLVPLWPGNPFGGRVNILKGLVLKRIGTGKDDDGAPPRPKKTRKMAPVELLDVGGDSFRL